MDKSEYLSFLKQNTPMPNDDDLTDEIINKYIEVVKYFSHNKDNECISLLLNSFGEYDGRGVYQLVEDAIIIQDKEVVINSLEKALQSKHNGVRYWCAQIAASFPSDKLVDLLINLLKDSNDIKMAAVMALSQFNDDRVILELNKLLEIEEDEENKEIIMDAISTMND